MNSLPCIVGGCCQSYQVCSKPAQGTLWVLWLTSYAVTKCVLHSRRKICRLTSMLSHAGETRPCKTASFAEGILDIKFWMTSQSESCMAWGQDDYADRQVWVFMNTNCIQCCYRASNSKKGDATAVEKKLWVWMQRRERVNWESRG